jgi:hemolysin activation/secretion protein
MTNTGRLNRPGQGGLVLQWFLVALALSVVSLFAPSIRAQGPLPPGAGPRVEEGLKGFQKPEDRLLAPEDLKPLPDESPLRLPPISPRPRQPDRLAPGILVSVKEFVFSGNTVFTDAQLRDITAAYTGREITSEELEEVRHQLTVLYVNAGYVNSGAVVPDQDVEDGTVRIDIIEGVIGEIAVEGTKTLDPEFIRERVELGAGAPLNVKELGDRLQIIVQEPQVARINADLQPGDRPGEANLLTTVEETRPHDVSLVFDNHLVSSLGDVRGVARGRLYNLSGWGDVLNVELEFAEGLNDFYGSYSRPFTPQGTRFTVFGETERTKVVNDFEFLNIKSEFWQAGFAISHPVYQTPRDRLVLSGGIDRRHSQTFLLGRGFPFSPGVEPDGTSDTAPLRFSQEWLTRTRSQIFAFRSTFNFGLDWLGATSNPSGEPSGEYFAWLGQAQWARVLDSRGTQVLFRATGQYTPDQLLPMEQFSVGGARSVRGYDENQLVRDMGFSASIEIRYPVLRSQGRSTLQLAAFFDGGGAWNNVRPTPDPEFIGSPGVGVLWDPIPGIHAELYYGYALNDIQFQEDSLQADGVHFQFVVNVFDL